MVTSLGAYYYYDGALHRDDNRPAFIGRHGELKWCIHGRYRRTDGGPTIRRFDGTQLWTAECGMIYHRDGDLPAVIDPDGTLRYYLHGYLHRDFPLPAVKSPYGYREYWYRGWLTQKIY
jgi:hypothetical protein